MKIELTRVKIKKGKSDRVTEWLKFINDTIDKHIPILDEEKMYVECIFREFDGEDEYLYWFDIRDEGGRHISESPHEVDKIHMAFWHECLEDDGKRNTPTRMDLNPEVVMIPERIKKLMQ